MRIQTFSIVAGSKACNARCPFCVSKMTVRFGVGMKEPKINWRNFRKACQLAKACGVTTAMITGKGEPTLYPGQITRFLRELKRFEFPFAELQTNGIALASRTGAWPKRLKSWYDLGLTTVAVSVAHHDPRKNREIYLPHRRSYIDLPRLIGSLHRTGLSVRLAGVMARGYIDDVASLKDLIAFAKKHAVEQMTVRPVNRPKSSRSQRTRDWASKHCLSVRSLKRIEAYLERNGTRLMTLMHGAIVYDVGGQNVCLTDSLSTHPSAEDIRQLIFFPDGHLRYDWQHAGAILI